MRNAPLALLLAVVTLAGCFHESAPAKDVDAAAAAPVVEVETAPSGQAVATVPHVHDYWAGRERVTLFDDDLTVSPPSALIWGVMTTRVMGSPAFGGAFVQPPEGAIVYEGTGRLEITVSWTDPGVTGIRFLHRHAGSGEIQPWVETPKGETVVLDVEPEMTDMPHAETSRWVFLFAASGTPAVAMGAFHVKIDIVRTRDVAEWPAHPDLWSGRAELALADAEAVSAGGAGPARLVEREPWREPEDAVPSQAVVPMETASVRVSVTVLGLEPDVAVDRLRLLVRTARDVVFDFDDAGPPADVSDDGLTWTWELPVEMDETDNPYAETSAWAFRVVAGSADADVPGCANGCHEAELRYHLAATARKAPAEGAA